MTIFLLALPWIAAIFFEWSCWEGREKFSLVGTVFRFVLCLAMGYAIILMIKGLAS